MRAEDQTLTLLLHLFDQARRLDQPLEITSQHIKMGEICYPYYSRVDEAFLDALIVFERYYATAPGYKDGGKIPYGNI